MNPDDFTGLPTIKFLYFDETLVGRRVVVDPFYTASFLSGFVKAFSGITGTIVAHKPIFIGLTGSIGTWYFKPDGGHGMVIPVYPFDVVFLNE